MELVHMTTNAYPRFDRVESWRSCVSSMIHNVDVANLSSKDFFAEISVRRHKDISCGLFRSKPHDLSCGREQLSQVGSAGYLVSWQIEGSAFVEQHRQAAHQTAGFLTIVDGRRPMRISFKENVRRIVAKISARHWKSASRNWRPAP